MKFNFNGVQAPESKTFTPKTAIEPGIQPLKIVSIEEKTASTGTAYLEVVFDHPTEPVDFKLIERFFASPKSLFRLQHFLTEVLERDFEGMEVDIAELRSELLNKVNTYCVDGEQYLKQMQNGETRTFVRARLAFQDFVNPPASKTVYIKPLPPETAGAANNTGFDATDVGTSLDPQDDDLPF